MLFNFTYRWKQACPDIRPGCRLALGAILLLALAAFAQLDDLPNQGRRAKSSWVTAVPVAPVPIAPGKTSKVVFAFQVMPGFHINSNRPKGDLLRPTALKVDPPTDITVGKVNYPAGSDVALAFEPGEKLNVYTGEFAITAVITATAALPAGSYRVHAALKYQACDDRQCYPPREVPADFEVKVQPSGTARYPGTSGQKPR